MVPSIEDLTDEAFTILTAAADTTGHAMAILALLRRLQPRDLQSTDSGAQNRIA